VAGMLIRLRIALDVPTSHASCEIENTVGLYVEPISSWVMLDVGA
jgi:hypothetical protein